MSKSLKFTVTDEELALLNGPLAQVQPKSVDRGFKYRNLYLLMCVCLIVIRALFFPDFAILDLAETLGKATALIALQVRGLVTLSIGAAYLYAYLNDWHFERLGWIMVGIFLAFLIRDIVFSLLTSQVPLRALTMVEIILRMGVLVCLVLNALRDHRAPSMPRTLWS
jgi:hypothetical protein